MIALIKAAPGEVEVGHLVEFLPRMILRHWDGLTGDVSGDPTRGGV